MFATPSGDEVDCNFRVSQSLNGVFLLQTRLIKLIGNTDKHCLNLLNCTIWRERSVFSPVLNAVWCLTVENFHTVVFQ